jgi:hypothetical protein
MSQSAPPISIEPLHSTMQCSHRSALSGHLENLRAGHRGKDQAKRRRFGSDVPTISSQRIPEMDGWMVAFAARDRVAVDKAYAAALGVGGQDEGPPGLRPDFGPNYYGAYVRDLDGNKLHFVCREAV